MNNLLETFAIFCIPLLTHLVTKIKLLYTLAREHALEVVLTYLTIAFIPAVLLSEFKSSAIYLIVYFIPIAIVSIVFLTIKYIIPATKKTIKYIRTTWRESNAKR